MLLFVITYVYIHIYLIYTHIYWYIHIVSAGSVVTLSHVRQVRQVKAKSLLKRYSFNEFLLFREDFCNKENKFSKTICSASPAV